MDSTIVDLVWGWGVVAGVLGWVCQWACLYGRINERRIYSGCVYNGYVY